MRYLVLAFALVLGCVKPPKPAEQPPSDFESKQYLTPGAIPIIYKFHDLDARVTCYHLGSSAGGISCIPDHMLIQKEGSR